MRTRSRLCCVCLALLAAALAVPPPTAAQVLPLGPTIDLREPDQEHQHTGPGVALRPDGGFVAAWTDTAAGQVLAAAIDPETVGQPELDLSVLGPPDDTRTAPVVARGVDGSYLAVWRTGLLTGSVGLVARPVDGAGEPVGARRSVAGGAIGPFALAARPNGGFVVAWWQDLASQQPSLRFRFLGAEGSPVGGLTVVTEVEEGGDLSASVDVATAADGTFALSWSWRRFTDPPTQPTDSGLLAQLFDALGSASGDPLEVVPPADATFGVLDQDLVFTNDRFFLVMFGEVEDPVSIPPTLSMVSRRLDPVDRSLGPVRAVDGGVPGVDREHATLAFGLDGRGVAAWSQQFAEGPRIVARLIDPNGIARSGTFEVASLPEDVEFVNRLRADRDATGVMVFGWGAGFTSPFIPTGAEFYWRSQARRLVELDDDCGPIASVALRTEPEVPTEDDAVELLLEGQALCSDVTLVDWTLDGSTFRVEAEETARAECEGLPLLPFELALEAGRLDAGEYEVELDVDLEAGGTCSRELGFTVLPSGSVPPPPPPPDRAPLTSDALPGFRVWVDIVDQQGIAVAGVEEPACIPETVCVSGRLPGRSEVFVRVIGPRPNGRLWPVLVKFTTSEVEVWIEQIETGEVEYYRLRGARPGFDELPGLFDREGFEP